MVQHSLMGPTKEFCNIFSSCANHVKAREKALQDYAKVQAKLERFEEKEHTAANDVNIAKVSHFFLFVLLVCYLEACDALALSISTTLCNTATNIERCSYDALGFSILSH